MGLQIIATNKIETHSGISCNFSVTHSESQASLLDGTRVSGGADGLHALSQHEPNFWNLFQVRVASGECYVCNIPRLGATEPSHSHISFFIAL